MVEAHEGDIPVGEDDDAVIFDEGILNEYNNYYNCIIIFSFKYLISLFFG